MKLTNEGDGLRLIDRTETAAGRRALLHSSGCALGQPGHRAFHTHCALCTVHCAACSGCATCSTNTVTGSTTCLQREAQHNFTPFDGSRAHITAEDLRADNTYVVYHVTRPHSSSDALPRDNASWHQPQHPRIAHHMTRTTTRVVYAWLVSAALCLGVAAQVGNRTTWTADYGTATQHRTTTHHLRRVLCARGLPGRARPGLLPGNDHHPRRQQLLRPLP